MRSATAARAKSLGLTREDVKALGLRDVRGAEARRLVGAARPGIWIPYPDADGDPTGFGRLRATDGEEPKYLQPRATTPHVYLPGIGPSWADAVTEPEPKGSAQRTPAILVEGEFKAAYLAKLGALAAGLGGVWAWQAKRAGLAVLPDLSALELAGRDVLIAFDSDVVRNRDVARARDALTDALVGLSARVHWLEVPDLDAVRKSTGIDDYLTAQPDPRGALAALVASAVPHAGVGELRTLNAHYLHVQGPKATGVYSLRDGRFLSYTLFDRELAGRKVLRRTAKGSLAEVPVATVWLDWAGRTRAKGFCFRPGLPLGLTASGEWNTASPPPEAKRGDVGPFLELVDFLFQHEEPSAKRWFLGWCGHPFRRPREKLLTAVYLWSSQQGAGKGQLARCLATAHGEGLASMLAFDDLRSDFVSARVVRKTFVCIDEASGGFETREYSGRVKKLVTDPVISVNQKYQPAYEIENAAAWLLTTNHLNSIKIEREARRFLVIEGPRVDPEHRERNQLPLTLVRKLNAWLEGPVAGPALVHWLRTKAPRFVNDAMAPSTRGFEALTSTMLSAVDEFARACCTTGVWEGKHVPELAIVDDLVRLYERSHSRSGLTRQGLGIALAHAGAKHLATARGKLKRIHLPDGRQAVPVALREHARWEKETTAKVVGYLVAHTPGGDFRASDPHSEVVRLRAALRSAEERAKKKEKSA